MLENDLPPLKVPPESQAPWPTHPQPQAAQIHANDGASEIPRSDRPVSGKFPKDTLGDRARDARNLIEGRARSARDAIGPTGMYAAGAALIGIVAAGAGFLVGRSRKS